MSLSESLKRKAMRQGARSRARSSRRRVAYYAPRPMLAPYAVKQRSTMTMSRRAATSTLRGWMRKKAVARRNRGRALALNRVFGRDISRRIRKFL